MAKEKLEEATNLELSREEKFAALKEEELVLREALNYLYEEKKQEEGYVIGLEFERNPNIKKSSESRIKEINGNIIDIRKQLLDIEKSEILLLIEEAKEQRNSLIQVLNELYAERQEEDGYLIEMSYENNPNLRRAGTKRIEELNENILVIERYIKEVDEYLQSINEVFIKTDKTKISTNDIYSDVYQLDSSDTLSYFSE